ncbi:MAG: choice-of-anchor R domain-containing protein [Chthoniobacteraceae bacterium]
MKNYGTLLAIVITLCVGSSAHCATLFSNLGKSDDEGLGITFQGAGEATDFLTSSTATTITSATLALNNFDSIDHHLTVELLANKSGAPDALVGTLGVLTVPASQMDISSYTISSAGILLAANTKYWIAIFMNEGVSGGGYVSWSATTSQATDSGSLFATVSSTSIKYSDDGGATYQDETSGNFRFALSNTPAPEPTCAMLIVLSGITLFKRRVFSSW